MSSLKLIIIILLVFLFSFWVFGPIMGFFAPFIIAAISGFVRWLFKNVWKD